MTRHIMKYKLVVTVGCLLITVFLGFVDYITGDYSLVIFYLFPITLSAWLCGRWSGLGVAACSGATRVVSDFSLHGASMRSALHYWNFSVEVIFFLFVASLVATLKRALAKDDVR